MSAWLIAALRLACAVALLLIGTQALMHAMAALGTALGTFAPESDPLPALAVYFRVVILKGLLPQVMLAFALCSIAARLLARSETHRLAWRRSAELAVASLAAFAVVAPLLLTRELHGMPAMVMTSASNVVWSAVLMTTATTACLPPRCSSCRILLNAAERSGLGCGLEDDRWPSEASGVDVCAGRCAFASNAKRSLARATATVRTVSAPPGRHSRPSAWSRRDRSSWSRASPAPSR